MKKTRVESVQNMNLAKVLLWVDEIIVNNPDMTYKDFSFGTFHPDPWEEYKYSCLEYETEETENEKIQREKEEEISRVRKDEWDRQQFEQLKKKFEGKSA